MSSPDELLRPPHRAPADPRRYAICGLGLMGGSLGYALRHYLPGSEVVGIERNPERREEARRLEVADTLLEDLDGLDASTFDAVFLCTPVSSIAPLTRALAAQASGPAVVVDVGSVKGAIHDAVGELPPGFHFVGGHPMTGSALEGLEGADPHLYENAVFILTRTEDADPAVVQAVESLVSAVGGLPRTMAPDTHDDCVSTISHLPYLLAVGMCEVLQRRHGPEGGQAAPLAAGGFHGATRVAACTPEVFRDILIANRDALLRDLGQLTEVMRSFVGSLEDGDGQDLFDRFSAARVFRSNLPKLRKGLLPTLPEAIVKAKDQPGFIGQVATMIGAAQVNIRDIEVLHSREGEGGTLRIAFETEAGRAKALRILEAADFVASIRDY